LKFICDILIFLSVNYFKYFNYTHLTMAAVSYRSFTNIYNQKINISNIDILKSIEKRKSIKAKSKIINLLMINRLNEEIQREIQRLSNQKL
jgi:hypothetical protein